MRGRRRLGGDADGVLDHARLGAAVGHDAHPSHAQQRGAAVALVVEAMLHAVEARLQGQQRERRDRPLLQVGPQRAEDVAGQALEELDHHVADEPVAHDHVGDVADQVVALHVADEVQVEPAHQRVRLARQGVPLLVLLADVQQADAGASATFSTCSA